MKDEAEIEQRLPVWHAFADLFLDTETQPDDYARMGRVLRDAPFSSDELRDILLDEVAPAFVNNLIDPAGIWSGWHRDDVRRIMLDFLSAPSCVAEERRADRKLRVFAEAEWAKIEGHLVPR